VNPAASLKRPREREKEKSSLGIMGEDHGRCKELGSSNEESLGVKGTVW
jgi:hypothetical protein